MKAKLKLVGIGLLSYIIVWSATYVVVLKANMAYYFEYLWLSWTSPGEIPAFLQIVAIPTALVVVFLVWIILFRKRPEEGIPSAKQK